MSKEIRLPPLVSERQLRELVRGAIALRRHALVFQAAEIWEGFLHGVRTSATENPASEPEWQSVASLSQLRTLVGVRFQKLRDRWVAAGFPLKEHRGDRPIRPEVGDEAWAEFAAWLHREGFLVRRAAPDTDAYFEIARQEIAANGR